jgi:hypothetical protein
MLAGRSASWLYVIFKDEYFPGGIQIDLPHHSQGSFEL